MVEIAFRKQEFEQEKRERERVKQILDDLVWLVVGKLDSIQWNGLTSPKISAIVVTIPIEISNRDSVGQPLRSTHLHLTHALSTISTKLTSGFASYNSLSALTSNGILVQIRLRIHTKFSSSQFNRLSASRSIGSFV